jgi:integrase
MQSAHGQLWRYLPALKKPPEKHHQKGPLGTHSMRHSYRSWLDAVKTPIAVQQKMMRHASIKATMDVYGHIVTDETEQAHAKVVTMALNRDCA